MGEPQRRVRLRQPRVYRLASSLFLDLRPGDLVYLRDWRGEGLNIPARRPSFRIADVPCLTPNARGCFRISPPSNRLVFFFARHLHSVRFAGSRTRWIAIHA